MKVRSGRGKGLSGVRMSRIHKTLLRCTIPKIFVIFTIGTTVMSIAYRVISLKRGVLK